jgi:hypothetical protein
MTLQYHLGWTIPQISKKPTPYLHKIVEPMKIALAYDASPTSAPDVQCVLGVLSLLLNAAIGWRSDLGVPYPLTNPP